MISPHVVILQIRWPETLDADGETVTLADIFATIDGIHFPIKDFILFNPQFKSHKLGCAVLAYELVISIYDLTMFRDKVRDLVPPGHKLLGDQIYGAAAEIEKIAIKNPFDDDETKRLKDRALSRHESINKKLVDYNVLRHLFRSTKDKKDKHKACFEAIAVLVQYTMRVEPPFLSNFPDLSDGELD